MGIALHPFEYAHRLTQPEEASLAMTHALASARLGDAERVGELYASLPAALQRLNPDGMAEKMLVKFPELYVHLPETLREDNWLLLDQALHIFEKEAPVDEEAENAILQIMSSIQRACLHRYWIEHDKEERAILLRSSSNDDGEEKGDLLLITPERCTAWVQQAGYFYELVPPQQRLEISVVRALIHSDDFNHRLFYAIPASLRETQVALMLECVQRIPNLYTHVCRSIREQSLAMAFVACRYQYGYYYDEVPMCIKELSEDLAVEAFTTSFARNAPPPLGMLPYDCIPPPIRTSSLKLASMALNHSIRFYREIPLRLLENKWEWAQQAVTENAENYERVPPRMRIVVSASSVALGVQAVTWEVSYDCQMIHDNNNNNNNDESIEDFLEHWQSHIFYQVQQRRNMNYYMSPALRNAVLMALYQRHRACLQQLGMWDKARRLVNSKYRWTRKRLASILGKLSSDVVESLILPCRTEEEDRIEQDALDFQRMRFLLRLWICLLKMVMAQRVFHMDPALSSRHLRSMHHCISRVMVHLKSMVDATPAATSTKVGHLAQTVRAIVNQLEVRYPALMQLSHGRYMEDMKSIIQNRDVSPLGNNDEDCERVLAYLAPDVPFYMESGRRVLPFADLGTFTF